MKVLKSETGALHSDWWQHLLEARARETCGPVPLCTCSNETNSVQGHRHAPACDITAWECNIATEVFDLASVLVSMAHERLHPEFDPAARLPAYKPPFTD